MRSWCNRPVLKLISFSIQTMVLHFLVSWNEERLASPLFPHGERKSLLLPFWRREFQRPRFKKFPPRLYPLLELLIFGSLLTFSFSRDCAGSRAPYCGRK